MRKKRILTEEHKEKLRQAALGKKKVLSEEALENLRLAGIKRKGIKFGPMPEWHKEKIRKSNLGKKHKLTKENPSFFKKGQISLRKGIKLSPEEVEKMRIVRRNPNAKSKGSGSYRYRSWREGVLKNCDYRCNKCGKSEKLDCHHIIPWNENEFLRFEISNGIALCKSCHGKEDRHLRFIGNGKTQFQKGHKLSKESIEKMKKTKRERLSQKK